MTVVHDLIVEPQVRPLFGSVPVSTDDAIAGLALLSAALASGTSEIRQLSRGPDAAAMQGALSALGVAIETGVRSTTIVRGVGLSGFAAPSGRIDCAGSARTMRLLSAVLVGCPFETVLLGDEVVLGTSMVGVIDALRRRGGVIEGAFSTTVGGDVTPPLVVGPLGPRRRLSGIEYELSRPDADVKESLLFSGLAADDATYVRERIVSRDHAERMLQALDVPVTMAGPIVRLDVDGWSANLPSFSEDVPGDFSAAALLLAVASVVPGSRVCVRGTGLNPTRTGVLDLLRQMGGLTDIEVHRSALGEPEGVACASYAPLRATTIGGEALARAVTELPALAVLAARARGETEIADIRSLLGARLAADAIDRLAATLAAFGVACETREDGLVVCGQPDGPLRAADFDSRGDPGSAATATMLACRASGRTRVRRVDALGRRFPRLVGTLRALGAELRVEERVDDTLQS